MKKIVIPPFQQLPKKEKLALIALPLIGTIPKDFLEKFLEKYTQFSQIFRWDKGGFPSKFQKKIERINPEKLEAALAIIQQKNIRVIHRFSPEYPPQLNELKSPPIALFIRGELTLPLIQYLNRSIAIVGTRKPDSTGIQLAQKTAAHFANNRWLTISGGATGIDTQVHLTALRNKAPTAVILAGSITSLYPAENSELFEEIVKNKGLLIAEFPPGKKLERGLFPRRNRIISALSKGLVVIQCGKKSGALNTASWAEKLKRPIFTYPGPPLHPLTAGPHHLIRKGAHLVETPEEISSILSNPTQLPLWPTTQQKNNPDKNRQNSQKKQQSNTTPKLPQNLQKDEREILLLLLHSEKPLSIEEISLKVKIPPDRLAPTILELELKNLITADRNLKYLPHPKIKNP